MGKSGKRRNTLKLVSNTSGAEGLVFPPVDTHLPQRTIRRGGLFSELVLPELNVNEALDPGVFFCIFEILTKIKEASVLGGINRIENDTGIPREDLLSILDEINDNNVMVLSMLKIYFGLANGRRQN